jgi:hypothetical protein
VDHRLQAQAVVALNHQAQVHLQAQVRKVFLAQAQVHLQAH